MPAAAKRQVWPTYRLAPARELHVCESSCFYPSPVGFYAMKLPLSLNPLPGGNETVPRRSIDLVCVGGVNSCGYVISGSAEWPLLDTVASSPANNCLSFRQLYDSRSTPG